jgi:hypothetical protein
MREYNKEKIEKENAERYERIKKERGWAWPKARESRVSAFW